MSKWLIERAGVQVTVHAKSDAANKLVEAALTGMRTKSVMAAHGIRLTVSGRDGAWEVRDHATDIRRKLEQSGDLIYHLTDRIVFHIADSVKSKHCLHAASVAVGDTALMIPANSGAGKSSLTSWLVAQGFEYITDELILVDDDRRIEGIARPIQIKPNGIDAIEHLLADAGKVYTGRLANAITIENLGGVCAEQPEHDLRLVIFPLYTKKTDFSFTQLHSSEAGMRLMANHVNARNLAGHGFRAMMELIRNTPCYALEYGGFDKLPNDFAEQIKAILASHSA